MKRAILILALLMGFAFPLHATSEDGFTFSEGYWWKGGTAYSRQRVNWGPWIYPSHYYGYSFTPYQAYYYYEYTPAVKQIDSTAPDAESKLLDIAAARDRIEGRVRLANQKHAAFMEKVDKLGLGGNFTWQNYGIAPQGPSYGGSLPGIPKSFFYGNFGANGNTVYGYNAISQAYNQLDPNILFQQSSTRAQSALELGKQANTEANSLISSALAPLGQAATIQAEGIARARVLEASKGAPQSTTVIQGQGLAPVAPAIMPKIAVGSNLTAAQQVRFEACASCHSGPNAKAKFDIAMFDKFGPEDRMHVLNLLVTDDDSKRMPRKVDGSADRLPFEKFKAFLQK